MHATELHYRLSLLSTLTPWPDLDFNGNLDLYGCVFTLRRLRKGYRCDKTPTRPVRHDGARVALRRARSRRAILNTIHRGIMVAKQFDWRRGHPYS